MGSIRSSWVIYYDKLKNYSAIEEKQARKLLNHGNSVARLPVENIASEL